MPLANAAQIAALPMRTPHALKNERPINSRREAVGV